VKNLKAFLLLNFTGLLLLSLSSSAALTYYLDPVAGSDENAGTDPSLAWKTLAKAGSHVYLPGESLLLKAGSRSVGSLTIRGGGTATAPVTIGRYGSGPAPAIDGNGAKTVLFIRNTDHCIVEDLEITNRGSDQKAHTGIHFSASRQGAVYGPTLRRLWVHHVSGHDERNGGCGILVSAGPDPNGQASWLVGTTIEDNHLHDLPFNGILVSGWYTRGRNPDGTLTAPSTGLVIRGNLLYDIAGDGICIINTQGAVIEHNELHRGSTGQLRGAKTPSAGIWPHTSDDTIMRYNRVEGLRGSLDGQAFDVDIDCRRTIVEYNLSRNNGTGFLLLCSTAADGPTMDTVVRNNLSLDDAAEAPGAVLTIVGAVERTVFTNNAFIITRNGPRRFLHAADWISVGTWPDDVRWEKNLILTAGRLEWMPTQATALRLDGNLYQGDCSDMPADANGLNRDPGLLCKPVYQTWDTTVDDDSAARLLQIQPLNLKKAGLPAGSLWLQARDAAVLNNPPGPELKQAMPTG
jgi:hypothetical protein